MEIVSISQAKKIILAVVGFTIFLFGIALLVLPGPGIPFFVAGLSMLAAQFLWARRLLGRLKKEFKFVKKEVKRDFKKAKGLVS